MNYLDKVNLWKNYDNLDLELKNEFNNMSDDELKEAFTLDMEFGTGGLRGILGAGTNRINIYLIMKATLGFANYLKQFDNALEKGVVIAFDNRHKSKEFSIIASQVLCACGFNVYLYDELRPTPQLSFTVRHLNAIGGIMITASHNPKNYNGYKIYDETGCQLVLKPANEVINEINKIDDYFNIELKQDSKIKVLYNELDEIYLNDIKQIEINSDLDKNFKVVYTPLHGTGQVFAVDVLKKLGYDAIAVESQMTPDPNFSNVSSSNPENKEAFDEAIELAKKTDALLVLATDPDADRLGVGVLHNGEYILMTGNESATVVFDYIAKHNKLDNGYLFTTIVSSNLPCKIAEKYNIKTIETLTGFKFIGEQIQLLKKDENFVFGFEESYGCLIKDSVRDKDSIQAIIMLCEVASFYKQQGKTLIDALNDIYEEYGYYKNDITNISLTGLEGLTKINQIMDYFRNNEISISQKIIKKEDFLTSISYCFNSNSKREIDLPKSNVIKYYLEDGSWFVLRPSGTEPKLKIYYSIVGNASNLDQLLELLTKEILEIIDTI